MKGLSLFRLGSRAKPAAAAEPLAGQAGIDAVALDPVFLAHGRADERRSTPRRDVPLGPTFRAEFTLLAKPRSFNVEDLSLGGLGLRGAVDQGQGIFVGQKLTQVRLVLVGHAALVTDLEVRSYRFHRSFLIGEQLHVGCSFIELGPQAEQELKDLLAKLAELRGESGGDSADR